MNTLKKFISYYRPYRAVFYFDLFCAAVISVVDLAYPQLLRSLTKTLFTGNKSAILGALPWLFLILLIMYTIQSLCKYYVTCQGHIMGAKMERDMRKQLFEHYEKLSFSYYSTHNSGQMMSKLVSDLFDISELAHHGPENLFISLVKIIGSFVFLFLINQKLALPLLLLVILMILFSIRQNKKMQQTFLENRIRIGDINASLQDTLSGIRVVQSFANEDTELHKFNHSNEAFLESKKDNYRCMGTFMSSNLFFQGMMYLTTLIYGGYLIAMGQMQAADLAMYALYIGIFISPIQILVELVEMLQKGLSGFRRYLEVVETEPEIQDKEGAIDLENVKGDVCYDNVSFHYSDDNKTVLSQVSIHIPAGKSVALVGPSGGGKTTLCNLIARFWDVDSGEITLGGTNVKDYSMNSLMNNFSFVFQNVYLFADTIENNIKFGRPEATHEEVVEAAKKACCHDFISKLPDGYNTVIGEGGATLSGGEKQRISIARAIMKDSPIIILDEATANVDPENEKELTLAVDALTKEKTIIMIAHRLKTVRHADQIVVVDQGRIAQKGTHEELMKQDGIYRRFVDSRELAVSWKI
mgnify:CR=1 FL=1